MLKFFTFSHTVCLYIYLGMLENILILQQTFKLSQEMD